MSTEFEEFKPKKTIEEMILEKPITKEIVDRLFYVYKNEWESYVKQMTNIIDQDILDQIKDIKVLVNKIDTQPTSELDPEIKEKLFSDEKKKIFCMWLFKSHILCVNANERIVGRKIEHDLPVTFKIYLNDKLAERIKTINNLPAKIEQFNKAVDKILDNFKVVLEDKNFFFKRIDAPTSESSFDSFQVVLGFNTYYSKSEDIYIKTFVKELIEENKEEK